MDLSVGRHAERLHAALAGAVAGEAASGSPAGVRQLLDLADHLAAVAPSTAGVTPAGPVAHLDDAALRGAGLDQAPAGAPASLLLRGVLAGLLTPLDRPRLRQTAHQLALVAHADEGTAMTAVGAAVLAADLCRFDLETALVRLRQTLLEEAPTALHLRLRPLQAGEPAVATGDPGDALQLAITALDRAASLPEVLEAADFAGEAAVAAALAGALAGARDGFAGCAAGWAAGQPAAERVAAVAERLAAVAEATPPCRQAAVSPALATRLLGGGVAEAQPPPR